MDDVRVVEIEDGLGYLVDDVFFMFLLKNISLPNKSVEVNIHMFEDEVDIFVVVGFDYFLEVDDVGMFELLKKHNFAIDSLGVS